MGIDITKCAKCGSDVMNAVHTNQAHKEYHRFVRYAIIPAPIQSRSGLFIFLSVGAAFFALLYFLRTAGII